MDLISTSIFLGLHISINVDPSSKDLNTLTFPWHAIAVISMSVCLSVCLSIYLSRMNSEYGEWKLVIYHFSQLVSAVAVFKGICSHLKMKVISK